jgi:hypothetical protein
MLKITKPNGRAATTCLLSAVTMAIAFVIAGAPPAGAAPAGNGSSYGTLQPMPVGTEAEFAPSDTSTAQHVAPADVELASQGWHRLWGPVGVWTEPAGWASKPFHSRSSVLGVNFRCWWWRGSASMWATITNKNLQIVARSKNMQCDGHWKTLIYRHANTQTDYRMAVHVNPLGKHLVEVKAYDYW